MTPESSVESAGNNRFARNAPLCTGQFRKIAGNGFGDGANSYAYCYAWYRDHLYIGTNRNILVLIKRRFRFEIPFAVWPVNAPDEVDPSEQCGEIWRYHPPSGVWERVYRSPLTAGIDQRTVPLAAGFRNMAVFKGRSDPGPSIYTIPSCGSFGLGPVLMRCVDGQNFEVVSEPGMGLGDSNLTSFRGVLAFKGRLFVTPAGSRGFNPNVSNNATILCSDDPVNGGWERSCTAGFGDPTNASIHDMAAFDDHLYAGTMNIRRGYELWRTDAEGPPPHRWTKVLDRGAGRGSYNQAVVSMESFGEHLYVGSGIQNGGHDRINNIGPASAEVIRVRSDGRWDLVTGEPRMTADGLKVPTSGMGPGFDSPFAGYIWRISEHAGSLYIGTFDSSSFLPFSKIDERFGSAMDEDTMERFMAFRGGGKLWRSRDGEVWVPVTMNGFGNPYNFGIRTLQSTPYGLFVGTANPFGPEVAVRYPSGFRYEENPKGGLEIWHGCPENATAPDPAESVARHRAGPLRGILDPIRERGAEPQGAVGRHRVSDLELEQRFARLLDPTLALAEAGDLAEAAEREEHELETYFGGDVRNAGLWSGAATESAVLASRTLIAELIAMLDEAAPDGRRLSVLVIAEGLVGVCREISRLRPDTLLAGLSFDRALARRLRRADPSLEILLGERGAFRGSHDAWDAVVWIEGPAHASRQRSLSEIWRVLRPGGRLVAADLVEDCPAGSAPDSPEAMQPVAALERDLRACGFQEPFVADVTWKGWARFFQHSRHYFGTKFLLQQIDADRYHSIVARLPGGSSAVAAQLLYRASKSKETT